MANPVPDLRINDLSVAIDNLRFCVDHQQTYVRLMKTRDKVDPPQEVTVTGGPMGRVV